MNLRGLPAANSDGSAVQTSVLLLSCAVNRDLCAQKWWIVPMYSMFKAKHEL